MQNYSSVFQEVLGEFESTLCPASEADTAKGQVLTRTGYKINQDMDSDVGFISKNPGQTQHAGVSVDALLDRSDSTGADFLTDVDAGNGLREIKVAYTPYAPPPPGSPVPPDNWVQPTLEHVNTPGPLILKTSPEPEPPEEPDDEEDDLLISIQGEILELQHSVSLLSQQSASETVQILEAIKHFEDRFNTIVEDVEEGAQKILLILLANRESEEVPPVDPSMNLSTLILLLLRFFATK